MSDEKTGDGAGTDERLRYAGATTTHEGEGAPRTKLGSAPMDALGDASDAAAAALAKAQAEED